ncbi:FeoB-associated Cys-rich membrane protein [Neobacillus sp. OS1-2]|uniref:FeoB-associated Cys-rich membrane protein n=1 Tax=Neobacillus sp. OS1-2 TaxID=3070680 RepID=UPI0027DEFF99|nr:FeoB-associated Cys-rich membrane protein [Neobacillus sp. OS1-2]WML38620.1 FeoB-associated Cys-rich membrane protein [Neobacillus sp. OS1-2]
MIASVVIGVAIFGYAAYALVKFINKSKKGKCAACDLKNSCSSQCGLPGSEIINLNLLS